MSAILADLVSMTAQDRAGNLYTSNRDRHRWRRDRVELMIAELEPVIALELKYSIGGAYAPQVQEGQPNRTKVDKRLPRLRWVVTI